MKFIVKLLKKLWLITAIFLVLAAVLLSLARFFTPYLAKHKPELEKFSSALMNQPVRIGQVRANFVGFSPVFEFHQVEVLDDQGKKIIIRVQKLEIGINVIKSLMKRQLEPSLLAVTGTQLSIYQTKDDQIKVLGLEGLTERKQETELSAQARDIEEWLLTQGRITLRNIAILWRDKNNKVLLISDLSVQISNGLQSHQLTGMAKLSQSVPTKFRFVANLQGNLLKENKLNANVYVEVQDLLVNQWLSEGSYLSNYIHFHPKNGVINLQVWGIWRDNTWENMQAVFHLKGVTVESPISSIKTSTFDEASGDVFWQHEKTGWSIAGNNMHLRLGEKSWPEFQFSFINLYGNEKKISQQILQVSSLQLPIVKTLLTSSTLLSNEGKNALEIIDPSGELDNVIIQHEGNEITLSSLSLDATLNDISFSAWKQLPSIKHLNGYVQLRPESGRLTLSSEDVELTFGKLFREPLLINQLAGDVSWLKAGKFWEITSPDLVAANSELAINSNLKISISSANQNSSIDMLTSFSLNDLSKTPHYLPAGIMKTNLINWFDHAFINGRGPVGVMVLRGPLARFPFDHHEGRFVIDSKVDNVTLHFAEGWPTLKNLSGDLIFDGRSMHVAMTGGKTLDNSIVEVSADIPDLEHSMLDVSSVIQGDSEDALRFVYVSPLNNTVGKSLKDLYLRGPMSLALALTIPLSGADRNTKVDGKLQLKDNMLSIPDWDISLNKFQGFLHFTERDIFARDMSAVFFGQPVKLDVSTEYKGNKNRITQVDVAGGITIDALKQHFGFSIFDYLTGTTQYHALLELSDQNGRFGNQLIITSDLLGITVDMPSPLAKSEDVASSFGLYLFFSEISPLQLEINYANFLSAALTYSEIPEQKALTLHGGEITFGGKEATFQQERGLLITGELAYLDWSVWKIFLQNRVFLNSSQKGNIIDMRSFLRAIAIKIDQLKAFGQTLRNITLKIEPIEHAWSLYVDNAIVSGYVTVPTDFPHSALQGNFKYLYLSAIKGDDSQFKDPRKIPPFNIVSDNLYYGKKYFKHVELQVVPQIDGLDISHFRITSPNYDLIAAAHWKIINGVSQTSSTGELSSSDLGAALKQLKMSDNLDKGHGKATFQLNWLGAPYQLKVANLNGQIALDFNRGRIIDIGKEGDAEMGIGRVLGLFSLQSLPRRLSLDFSDLTKKGFSFDKMKGDFALNNGSAISQDAYFDGPVAKVSARGRIGLADKDYNLMLFVTPYLTSTLPIIATVAGGPVAGAFTWVIDKVINNEVTKVTTYMYKVTGPWKNPTIIKLSSANQQPDQSTSTQH